MAVYSIKAPDGRTIQIRAGDEATAIRGAQEWAAANPQAATPAAAAVPAGPTIKVGERTIPLAEYRAMPEDERQALRDQIADANPSAQTESSVLDPLVQGATFGFGDEIASAMHGTVAAAQGGDFGSTYNQAMDHFGNALAHERRVNPVGSVAAEIAGALPTGALGGGQLAGRGATLGMRALTSGAVGAGQGGAYGFGSTDGDLQDRAGGAFAGGLVGGAVGAAVPAVSNAIAGAVQRGQQGRVLNAAAKAAPSVDELKSAASSMFEQATGGTPLAVTDNAYMRFLGDVQQTAKQLRINETLDPKAVGLTEVMMSMADDLAQGGVSIDLKDLHILRQAAQRVAGSAEGRDKAFASIVTSKLDDFIGTLKNADIQGGADPKVAVEGLVKGISTWARANKVSLIEEAIRKGQAAASGPEKGVRNALRTAIYNKPDVWKRFSSPEQQAIKDVIDGTPGSNLLKLVGTFGFGGNTATNGIGGATGMALGSLVGGPVGLVAGPVVGSLARAGSERITGRLADRALGAAATEGLKVIPRIDPNQATQLERVLRRTLIPATAPLIQSR